MKEKRDTPDPGRQAELRELVKASSVHVVSQDLGLSRTQILQYLADVPMNAAIIRGIESTLASRAVAKRDESTRGRARGLRQ